VRRGLFIASLIVGATLGRSVGELLHTIPVMGPLLADAGTYSLIGAAATAGGIMRMTVSLVVVMIEVSGNIIFGVPLMITLLGARWAASYFNEGIYTTVIKTRKLPVLEWEPEKMAMFLRMQDLMVKDPVVLRRVVRAGRLLDILNSNKHNAFPVVGDCTCPHARSAGPGGARSDEPLPPYSPCAGCKNTVFKGIVLRKVLCVLLDRRAFTVSTYSAVGLGTACRGLCGLFWV
jgi:hypothetical protein